MLFTIMMRVTKMVTEPEEFTFQCKPIGAKLRPRALQGFNELAALA